MSLEQAIKRLSRSEKIKDKKIAPESDVTKKLREILRPEIDGRRYG